MTNFACTYSENCENVSIQMETFTKQIQLAIFSDFHLDGGNQNVSFKGYLINVQFITKAFFRKLLFALSLIHLL